MPSGGTTAIKPNAPLTMPNEQKWARDFDNQGQQLRVARSSATQNQNPNPEIQDMAGEAMAGIDQDMVENITRMNIGSIRDVMEQTRVMAGQMIFKEALKQSWLNIVETYGLTFIYINFHFIMAYLAKNKYFCRFGQEGALSFGGKTASLSQVDGGISETLMEYAEIAILFVVNGLIMFILLLVACLISFIVWAITKPVEFVSEMGIGAIGQAIVDLWRQL